MLRMLVVPLLILSAVLCCMGQTFQYSRGWTNGKRSSSHLREDMAFPEVMEYQDAEKRLEKCLIQLQHFVRNPLVMSHAPYQSVASNSNGKFAGHHQPNDFLEDLVASGEPGEFIKRQQSLMAA